jgi:hypothetical protein
MTRIVHTTAPPAIPAPHLLRQLVRPVFGVFGAPAAWIAQLLLNYALAAYPCMPNDMPYPAPPSSWAWDRPVLFVVNILALIVALAAAVTATADWRRTRGWNQHGALQARATRVRFLAYCGLMTGWGFLLAIAFNTVDLIGVPACSG